MPFKLWFYLSKVGGSILLVLVVSGMFAPVDSVPDRIAGVAMCLFVPLCLVGAFMGVLVAFDRLRMLCPFCGRSGRVNGRKWKGIWLECEKCGLVHASGPLGLKIVREDSSGD